jgi:hypothetical protein
MVTYLDRDGAMVKVDVANEEQNIKMDMNFSR